MRVNVAIPEAHVKPAVLNAALEATTRLNEDLLASGKVPTCDDGIAGGVRWRPEPPGEEHFDHAGVVEKRRWGDCDDLAPWQAASLRHTGEDPGARAVVRRVAPHRWHAIVKRSNGDIDDPSRRAGMGKQSNGVNGAFLPLMGRSTDSVSGIFELRPVIAIRRTRNGFQARIDVPWGNQYAMAALEMARSPVEALSRAINGACQLGTVAGFANPEHLDRLNAIGEALDGANYDYISQLYGDDHATAASQYVGSLFGKLKKVAKAATGPLASRLVSFVPGVGPIAASAMDVAHKMIPKGGGGGGVSLPSGGRQGHIIIPAEFR